MQYSIVKQLELICVLIILEYILAARPEAQVALMIIKMVTR